MATRWRAPSNKASIGSELLDAVRDDNSSALLDALQRKGADPNGVRRDDGVSPLYLASWHGRLDCARALLKHSAEVDAVTRSGWTPLMAACAWGWVELAELLIKHRAEVNKEDPEGTTPMLAAAARGRAEVIKLLLRHDAKTDAVGGDRHGSAKTAQDLAAVSGSAKSVDVLENAERYRKEGRKAAAEEAAAKKEEAAAALKAQSGVVAALKAKEQPASPAKGGATKRAKAEGTATAAPEGKQASALRASAPASTAATSSSKPDPAAAAAAAATSEAAARPASGGGVARAAASGQDPTRAKATRAQQDPVPKVPAPTSVTRPTPPCRPPLPMSTQCPGRLHAQRRGPCLCSRR